MYKYLNNMTDLAFKNDSGLEFKDISSEKWREYLYTDQVIRIDKPLKIHVSPNGHRVFDADQISHYIPNGWKHVRWAVYEGMANFSF